MLGYTSRSVDETYKLTKIDKLTTAINKELKRIT